MIFQDVYLTFEILVLILEIVKSWLSAVEWNINAWKYDKLSYRYIFLLCKVGLHLSNKFGHLSRYPIEDFFRFPCFCFFPPLISEHGCEVLAGSTSCNAKQKGSQGHSPRFH